MAFTQLDRCLDYVSPGLAGKAKPELQRLRDSALMLRVCCLFGIVPAQISNELWVLAWYGGKYSIEGTFHEDGSAVLSDESRIKLHKLLESRK